MFSWNHQDTFSFFILDKDGKKIPVSGWETIQSEYLSQFSILNELSDNGFAEHTLYTCEVDIIEILRLDEIDKQILCLPNHYPYEIYIQSEGQLNQSSFKFKFGFYDFTPNGTRFAVNRAGAIIKIDKRDYLLSTNQYLICEALEEFNSLTEVERTFQNNLKCFSDIKSFSKTAASYLDGYLESQNVYHPDKIKIEVEFINGALEIIPTIDIENSIGFTNVFDKFPSIREVYPVVDSTGGTTRVIIDEKQKVELQKIKANRRVTDPIVIQEIVEHPERFFDDENIDFTVFYSERVKEIGIYTPKFYPFVCPYKSEWIPGIIIKDKVYGEKRIIFKTPFDLDEFVTEKQIAQTSGKEFFEWQGTEIPIYDAEKFIRIAYKQFENQKEPAQKKEKQNDGEVLIIKENAELTEYVQGYEQLASINHSFSEIKNLNSFIALKEHQIEGISWLQTLQKENFCGCLLADDMGLGKTLQLLYFIEWHSQNHNDLKPYLIVAPVSLLENWENEYKKFFLPQSLPLINLYGSNNLTREFNQKENQSEAKDLQRKHIILTNYETLKTFQATLCLVDFAVVALDEAQKIKTPGTLVTNVSKALKADFKIAMTGTPVENTLIDLWCIMDFSVPGLLGNAKDFAKEFQNPLKEDETDVKELTERLRDKIGVFIKRRLKKDVAKDLPTKFDNIRVERQMPMMQFERYIIEIEQAKNADLSGLDKRNQILKSLWAIRDISDHPFLVESQICNYSTDELIAASAKLQIVIGLLADIKSRLDKVIVFADRKETQKMLQKVIYDSFRVFPSIVNGDTPTTKKSEGKTKLSRQQTIDRFQAGDGFNVIIMSPLAAGVGLNVTEANHIIHYTRHWNPAKEEQATDRAYRIGQRKDVYVYYPMAVFPDEMRDEDGKRQKSFDEILDDLLIRKKALATNTLFPSEQAEVKPAELFNIFGFDTESKPTPLTIKQIDKLNPNLFEAYVAALYTKQGFQVYLTPYSNDKGVDVVALKNGENYLFQAKQTKSLVGNEAIQEIYTARNYYESKFKEKFQLLVISNSDFSSSAETLARTNHINLIKRNQLDKLISKNDISIQDVNKHESQRMQRI
ncbi:SNF2-related protein [Mucilaginibacter sp.]|uniref:SNF2-related protein n=1 Tax=Mucilaginibacter sp. TaxID=1882438 RepID=UPI0026280D2B|nr:SNF2-related protein [Mucilaginibacter sp.]MDB4926640.1 SNF2/helicase/endonuclease domain protein [Mucilaginibacter sp.]